MRDGPGGLQRQLRGPAERRRKLRRVRQGLRGQPDVRRRSLRLPRRPKSVWRPVHRRELRPDKLWRLWYGMWHRSCLPQRHMPMHCKHQGLQWRLHRHHDRCWQLRCVRQDVPEVPVLCRRQVHAVADSTGPATTLRASIAAVFAGRAPHPASKAVISLPTRPRRAATASRVAAKQPLLSRARRPHNAQNAKLVRCADVPAI
jgi:hypothetical protein